MKNSCPPYRERFQRTVERITKETFWLRTEQVALDAMTDIESIGLDFFRVSMIELEAASLLLFEADHEQVQCHPPVNTYPFLPSSADNPYPV